MEITPEMRETARIVGYERASARARRSWDSLPRGSYARDLRWGKQVFSRLYAEDRLAARRWAVSRFGSDRAKRLIADWTA